MNLEVHKATRGIRNWRCENDHKLLLLSVWCRMGPDATEEGKLEVHRGRSYKSVSELELYPLTIILLVYANNGTEVQKE